MRTLHLRDRRPSVALRVSSRLLVLILLVPVPAIAQGDPKWEIDVHGGGILASNPTAGAASQPGPGTPFTTAAGAASRRISSWHFGDGAVLLNQLAGAFNVPPRVTPLDSVLATSGADRRGGRTVGVRVSRRLTPRFSAEFSLDYAQGSLELTDAMRAGIEASHSGVRTVINSILVSTGGPFTNVIVTSTATLPEDQKARQIFTTGAVKINLVTQGRFIPYVTVGGGRVSNGGDLPSVTIVGNYQFRLFGVAPMNETDTVTLRYIAEDAFVTLLGGGIKREFSPRWGLRADLRAYFSKNTVSVLLNANPVVATGTPAAFIASFTNPSLQVSNNPSTGVQSTLSGPAISDFKTFAGSGTQRHINITAGLFVRF